VDLYNASVTDARAKKKLQQTGSFSDQTMYAITTLVDIIGDYVTPRKGALRAWAAFKEGRAEDQDPFWHPYNITSGCVMDVCTISDFLAHVVPIIAGDRADAINKAFGRPCVARKSTEPAEEEEPPNCGFDRARAFDMTYCAEFTEEKARSKNLKLRTIEHEGQTKHNIVDLMFCTGEYNDRGSAKSSWGHHKKEVTTVNGFSLVKGGTANKMEFCSLAHFFEHVLPHVRGPVATAIKFARGMSIKTGPHSPSSPPSFSSSSGSSSSAAQQTDQELVQSQNEQETVLQPTEVTGEITLGVNAPASFDSARACDLAYCIEFFEETAARKKISIRSLHHNGLMRFGAVDLIFCVGDYASRDSAKASWQDYRAQVEGNSYVFKGPNRMDFCSLVDFLDYVLPHISGTTASQIRLARSSFVSTAMNQVIIDQKQKRADAKAAQPSESPCVISPQSTDAPPTCSSGSSHYNPMDSVPFDESRATDLSYLGEHIEARIAAYNSDQKSIRGHLRIHKSCSNSRPTGYGIADMMFTLGDYRSRKGASESWRVLKRTLPNGFGGVRQEPFWFDETVNFNPMDFCTLRDFLDHILPHISGSLAGKIVMARSRVATAVGVGSSLAIAITEANAESATQAPTTIRDMVSEIRCETESSLLAADIVRSSVPQIVGDGQITVDDVEVEFVNMPEGTHGYRRVSIEKYIPNFVPPAGSKLRLGAEKLGLTDGVSRRHKEYKQDGGFFDFLIKVHSYIDVDTIERMQKAAIWRHRMYNSDEYYSVKSYQKAFYLSENEDPYLHLLQQFTSFIQMVYVATVTVTEITQDPETQTTMDKYVRTSGKSKAPAKSSRYRLTVEYKEMADWEEFCKKPIVVRQGPVEAARLNLKAAEANEKAESSKLQQEKERTQQETERTQQEKERTQQKEADARAERERTQQEKERTRRTEMSSRERLVVRWVDEGRVTPEEGLRLLVLPVEASPPPPASGATVQEASPPSAPEVTVQEQRDQDVGETIVGVSLEEQRARFQTFYADLCRPEEGTSAASIAVTAAYRVWLKRVHDSSMTRSDISELKKFMLQRHQPGQAWDADTKSNQVSYNGVSLRPMEYLPMTDADFDEFVRDRCSVQYLARSPYLVLVEEYQRWRENNGKVKLDLKQLKLVAQTCLGEGFPRNHGAFTYEGRRESGGIMGIHLKGVNSRSQLSGESSGKTYRKAVEKVDVQTGQVVAIFKSAGECNKALGRGGVSYIPRGEIDGFTYRIQK